MRLEDLHNQRLGRYTVTDLIGRGGMAAVYRAHDTVLRRDVALKVLYPQFRGDLSLIARFQREAILAAQLDHAHIVPIYDVGEADGLVYIAMKLLNGPSLADLLHQQPRLPLPQVVAITAQVAEALDYAHSHGVVHRDVKPANVLIESGHSSDRLRVLLTDFGIAKSLGEELGLTGTNTMLGSPGSMAPEQITRQPIGPYTDVYGLGVLVFRCLTGRLPFEGTTEAVLLGHLNGDVPAPSSLEPTLPVAVDQVVRTALARQSEQRYASAGAFAEALQAAASAPRAAADEATARGVIVPPVARRAPHEVSTAPGGPVPPSVRPASAPPAAAPIQPAPGRRSRFAPTLTALALLVALGGTLIIWAQSRAAGIAGAPTASPTSAPTAATRPANTPIALPTTVITPTARPTASPTISATPTDVPAPTAAPTDVPAPTAAPSATPRPAPRPTPQPTAVPTAVPTSVPPPVPTAVPTLTSTPSSTPTATPTSTTTATATPCPTGQGVAEGFVRLLAAHPDVHQRLGCSQGRTIDSQIDEQGFQKGGMIWFQSINVFYVFFGLNSGSWLFYDGGTVNGMAPQPTEMPPPDLGLYPPTGLDGFSLIWSNEPQVRQALGWPNTPVINVSHGARQRFEHGSILYSADPLGPGPSSSRPPFYVLYNDGTFERY